VSTLHVYDAAREFPQREALVVEGHVMTWEDMDGMLAPYMIDLLDRGVTPGHNVPVPIVASISLDTIQKLLALITAGVPVQLIHPALTPVERQALIDALEPIDSARFERNPNDPPMARGSLNFPDVDARDEHPLAVVYTSGTSGRSKGVVLSRRAFVWSARASEQNLGWRDDDRWLLRIPVAHIGGLSTVTRCLLARRCIVLADEKLSLLDQIERDRVTICSLVPTQLRRLIDASPGRRPPAHLRAVLLGGGPAPADLLADAADLGWPVLTTYGMTETCAQIVTQPVGTVNRGELGAGLPLPGVGVRIVHGVIEVRGRMLFSGYFPSRGRGGPPLTPDGWFVTGDRGTIDDQGCLHVLGRTTDLIISGGENVDPFEVEAVLRDLPGIADACVFGVADREYGERVAAVLVPSGESPALATIDAAVRQWLAPFKRPRLVAFASGLPLNANGKVDRRVVARAFSDRLMPLTREG
jgi:o-succinylbenzoate---CoA ligase